MISKNIKRVIACVLALGTVSVAIPATNYNLLTTKAYADNDDSEDVTGLTMQDKVGVAIKLYTDSSCTTEASGTLHVDGVYYTKTTEASIKFTSISGPDTDEARIFRGNETDSDEDYEIGDFIKLTDDTTTLKLRVYENDYDDDKDYDSHDYNQYEIKVIYTGDDKYLDDDNDDDDDDDDSNDEDYLEGLYLYDKNDKEIKLYEDEDYEDKVENDDLDDDNEGDTYYAKTSSDKVRIETDGVDDDYVRVFKSTKDSAKAIEVGEDFSISGNSTLTVRIYDDEPDDDIEYGDDDSDVDVVGEYEIKLKYTGTDESTSTNSNQTGTIVSTFRPNQWALVNGFWQYNDSLGRPITSQWYYDKGYGKWYYLGVNGNMLTNSWILTGGKYYFVGIDGAMVTNTYINGYRIGADGAWIQ